MKLRYLALATWLLGMLFVLYLSPTWQSEKFQSLLEDHQTIRVNAEVLTEPDEFRSVTGAIEFQSQIRVVSPDYLVGKTGLISIKKENLNQGQFIDAVLTFRKSSRPDFDFRARLKYLISSRLGAGPDFFQAIRKSFSESVRGITEDSAALVTGLAIGDDSKLSSQTKEAFKTVSLAHLTAVSGANCAIVLGFLALLINRLPFRRWQRIAVSLLAIVGYLALVGPEPSVLRASVMVVAVLIGFYMGRRVNPVDALALSVIVLVIFDPRLAVDYGFALSVFATLGLLVLAPKLITLLEKKIPRWLAIGLAVTIAAQIACLPILLVLQPEIPVYSVLANLLAEPLVIPITVLGLISCMLALAFPILAGGVSLLASIPASWVIAIANYLANAPFASLPWYPGSVGIVLAIVLSLGIFFLLSSRSQALKAISALGVLLVSFGWISQNSASAISQSAFYSKKHTLVNCDVGQGDALVIQSQGKIALIDVGRENPAIDRCLTGLGISTIDLLVLTHFDMDHVGGILGAVSGRNIGNAIVSPFPDNRPGADFAEQILRNNGIKPVAAEVGMFGKLGRFHWKVLSPHRDATEAKDSNDASIGMIWESDSTVLFTLADLGESGQLRIGSEHTNLLNREFPGKTVVVKVAHHGSADQAAELYEAIRPEVAIISVGRDNSYGHPTKRTLDLLQRLKTKILRTDEHGAIGLLEGDSGLTATISGRS